MLIYEVVEETRARKSRPSDENLEMSLGRAKTNNNKKRQKAYSDVDDDDDNNNMTTTR